MTWVHYSKQPLVGLNSVRQLHGLHFKPHGLWITPENEKDNWPDWCRNEDYGLNEFRYKTTIHIKEPEKILTLDTVDDILGLFERYSTTHLSPTVQFPNWERIALEWKGILIPRYHWQCRLDVMWYYPWDCSSGCIWDMTAVEMEQSEPIDGVPIIKEEIGI